ncbi:SEC-C domain-containing protein [Vibrio mimicus]|uniref:SEC-C domain-containing protein n=1 Tax=Vibrio mimicus TaxID=674 RepID=UPI0011D7B8CF|nr:SEC-C domain-containing protein [Vibrio mimicus]TXX97358.1 SEC-C domain-containing protein [Vibrio mimicus]
MSLAGTPKEIDEVVMAFCNEVVAGSNPYYVNVLPDSWAKPNECFPNVARKVEAEQGKIVYGWQVWVWPDIFIEAEFHAIWQSPAGEFIDITPKQCKSSNILFIPAPELKYHGTDVDNIRKSLSQNKLVDDFILLSMCRFQLLSAGTNADSRKVRVSEHELLALTQLHQMVFQMLKDGKTSNAQCLCGSGSKFKHCHKKHVQQAAKHYGVAI